MSWLQIVRRRAERVFQVETAWQGRPSPPRATLAACRSGRSERVIVATIRGEVDQVIIECPACRSRYQYDEDRFERKPSKKIKCARCKEVFEIRNPAFEEKKSAPRGDATAPSPHESTRTRTSRPAIETKEEEPAAEPERGANQAPLQMPSGRRLSLALLDGPDAGKVFRIEKPNITIGRAGADLNLNDTEASRLHAGIEIRDTFYLLSDLGSTNGTIYAGEKLTGAVELADKAEFQVGVTTLMLIVTEEF